MPPIIASHVIFGAYGFWLPNDPRGSWSDAVWAQPLRRFGPPVPANTRRSRAHVMHDSARCREAKTALQQPAVSFTGQQALEIARGIGTVSAQFALPIYAAAIMPDHVHLVIANHRQKAEDWLGYFKRAATRAMNAARLHPFAETGCHQKSLPSPWAVGGWSVYLHTVEQVERTIRYVSENPIRAGFKPQNWSFVVAYPAPRGRGG